MVGSKDIDFKIDFQLLVEKFQDNKIKKDLSQLNIKEPFDLLSFFLIGEGNVYQQVAYTPLNTDDHPLIEFRAPRSLYRESGQNILANLKKFTRCGFPPIDNFQNSPGGLLEMHFKLGGAYTRRGKHLMAIEEFGDCLEINSELRSVRFLVAMSYHHLGMDKEAAAHWKRIMEMAPDGKEAKESLKHLKECGLE